MSVSNNKDQTRAQAIRGSFWTVFGFGGSQFIRLAGNLVLAWLLFPEAFGLMALVNVFMRGLQMFSDFGIGPAVIQNPRGEEVQFRRVAWTIQIVRGLALWIISCLLAWPVARFYSSGHPDAMMLLQVLPAAGLSALFAGFNSTSLYVLNRRMKIGMITLLELVPQVLAMVIMVLWAIYIERSVWALVAGGLSQSLLKAVLSHLLERGYSDGLAWDRKVVDELVRFGGWIFASTLISFLVTNLDRIVLGRLLSLAELGLYSIAMTFARLGMQVTTRLGTIVLFPLLTKRQHQPVHLMALCFKGRRLVLLTGGAVCVAFALIAPLFFEFLYDERYHAAGPLSRWLAIYVWSWILVATIDRVPLAMGKTRTLFISNLINVFSMALAAPGYLLFGLPGFIIGLATAQVISLLYVNGQLPADRMRMLMQSIRYTVGYGGFAALGMILLHLVPDDSVILQVGISVLLAVLSLLTAGIVALKEIKRKDIS